MALFSVKRDIFSTNGAILRTETWWGLYPDSVDCTPEEVIFLGYSQNAKLALVKNVQPVATTGTHWGPRGCGVSSGDTYAVVSNSNFTPDESTGGGGGVTPDYTTKGLFGGIFNG